MHPPSDGRAPRRLSLVMREEPNRYGNQSGYRIDLEGAGRAASQFGSCSRPRDRADARRTGGDHARQSNDGAYGDSLARHRARQLFRWRAGWGGQSGNLAPPVAPGQSFVAKFTPPRAGTFIYHTHWHKDAQLAGGLYGPLIVLNPGERYDPETDHIVVIGLNGVLQETEREPFALNGSATPAPIVMRAGVPNRLRLINITAINVSLDGVPRRSVRADDVETTGQGRRDAASRADRAPTGAPARDGRRDLRLRNSAVAVTTVVAGSAPRQRGVGVAGADQASLVMASGKKKRA